MVRRRTGYVLPLLLVIIAAMMAGSAVFLNRLAVDINARRAAEVRAQALWLARSALTADVPPGAHSVQTALGLAQVQVQSSGIVAVTLAGARASVRPTPYQERFEVIGVTATLPE